jgi:hypothetical protein
MIFGGLIVVTWLGNRVGAGQVLTFWIAYILTRPLGASLGDLLTQDRAFGGLELGASLTSLLFFTVIIVLVTREQVLANRHGVAEKGGGPIGGRRRDLAWATTGAAAVMVIGLSLSGLHDSPSVADDSAAITTTTGSSSDSTKRPGAQQAHPTTALGNVSRFAAIAADVQAKVVRNDLPGAKSRVKDLEVAWDDAEAGLKPRDPAKWHQLDDEIDGVLTSLRASHPTQSDCAATLAALAVTLDQFDGR